MTDRAVIRAHGNGLASIIAAMVFGGLAIFGLRIVFVAFDLGETGLWVWGLLAVSAVLLWAVIHALWNAFGVVLIISRHGIYRPGPFGGMRVPAEGLRVGRHDTLRKSFSSGSASLSARVFETTEIWALSRTIGAVLLWDGPRGIDNVARMEKAFERLLGLPVHPMTQRGEAGF